MECPLCRDGAGPIFALSEFAVLPAMPPDLSLVDRAVGYLRRHGWSGPEDGLVCPGCTADQRG